MSYNIKIGRKEYFVTDQYLGSSESIFIWNMGVFPKLRRFGVMEGKIKTVVRGSLFRDGYVIIEILIPVRHLKKVLEIIHGEV